MPGGIPGRGSWQGRVNVVTIAHAVGIGSRFDHSMRAHAWNGDRPGAEFKEEAKSGSDPDVKKFAEDTAKVIQEHLDLAKETQSKLK